MTSPSTSVLRCGIWMIVLGASASTASERRIGRELGRPRAADAREHDRRDRRRDEDLPRSSVRRSSSGLVVVRECLVDATRERREAVERLGCDLRGREQAVRGRSRVERDDDVVVADVPEARVDARERGRRLPGPADAAEQHGGRFRADRAGVDEVPASVRQREVEKRAQRSAALVPGDGRGGSRPVDALAVVPS